MPTPVPMDRKPKLATPTARPRQRSPSAARLTSFSTPMRSPRTSRSRASSPWRPQPGRLGARMTAPRVGSNTPGLPTVTCWTWSQPMPAPAARPGAVAPSGPIRAEAGLGAQPVGDGPELADQGAGAGGAGVLVAAGDHGPGDVGQGGPDPAAGDRDAAPPHRSPR